MILRTSSIRIHLVGSPDFVRGRAVHAFTLIELLTVIAIIGILAAITIPTIGKVRESARKTTCLSNVRSIGQALVMYGNDNKDMGPKVGNQKGKGLMWRSGGGFLNFGQLLPYLNYKTRSASQIPDIPSFFLCPAISENRIQYNIDHPGEETSYWLNLQATSGHTFAEGTEEDSVPLSQLPPRRVVITDYCQWWNPRPTQDNHAAQGFHAFRMNGSVTWLPTSKTTGLSGWIWSPLDDI
ncbi:prepilin-type N-terminal cleavage/methylation domain-containing protein [Opitutaceae bacterium TAV4]|nr:prepilin-type N-terminal cleavage/methylation domain-containing protein [Opitutaceae bacterium TAV4]RRK00256.1 prepilin-type N-terminal cleavage/methylation domain-containing protein [Opitutaceae bacterium TAV3]